jgi:5-methylcytosine-specific restriction endonuclease McrA
MTRNGICHSCNQLRPTTRGYCHDCAPAQQRARNHRPLHTILQNPRYKKARARTIRRDQGTCQQCGEPGASVHHETYDDPYNEDTMITLCASCHARLDGRRSHKPSRVHA